MIAAARFFRMDPAWLPGAARAVNATGQFLLHGQDN